MKKIIFYDNISTMHNLNHKNILVEGIGASEYQFYNLIKHISEKFITICFNITNNNYYLDNVIYISNKHFIDYDIDEKDIIIFHRCYPYDKSIINKFKYNLKYIWCHDSFNRGTLTGYIFDDVPNIDILNNFIINENNKNTYLIFPSNYAKSICINYFIDNHLEINDNKCIIIYNILYEEEFKFINITTSIDKNLIVYASAWFKGIGIIINLFESLYNKNNNLKLALLTPGYDMNIVNQYAPLIKEKFKDNVLIFGKQSKENYCNIIKSSLCVLSPRFIETFGCVFSESYYLGTPVIADIHTGAVKEIIDNSYIVDYDNIDEVYDKIKYIQDNRENICPILDEKMMFNYNFNIWCELLNSEK